MERYIEMPVYKGTFIYRAIHFGGRGGLPFYRITYAGGRVCIINVFKIKSPHQRSCNYLYYRLTLAFFSYDDILGNYESWAWRMKVVPSGQPATK